MQEPKRWNVFPIVKFQTQRHFLTVMIIFSATVFKTKLIEHVFVCIWVHVYMCLCVLDIQIKKIFCDFYNLKHLKEK